MTEPLRVSLRDGAVGSALAYVREILTLQLPDAYPPGKPMRLTCELSTGTLELAGKSIGSKRTDAGSFTVRMRLVGLRRQARLALESAFQTSGPQ